MFRLFATIVVALAGSATVAGAASLYVSTLGVDDMNTCLSPTAPCRTIAQAVALSESTDTVYVAGGKYEESVSLTDNGTLTISGSWTESFAAVDPEKPTVVSSKKARPFTLVYMGTAGDFTLEGVSITKSSPAEYQDGGALFAQVTGASGSLVLRLQSLQIVGNKANNGGGVLVENWTGSTAEVHIDDVDFMKNSAAGICGGLRLASYFSPPPSFEITNTNFEKNKAKQYGGGFCLQGRDATGEVSFQVLANTSFARNKAYEGGGLYMTTFEGHQHLHMNNCTFLKNKATDGGGAVKIMSISSTALTSCRSEMTSINNTMSGNNAKTGGTLLIEAMQVNGSTVPTDATVTSTNDIVYGTKSEFDVYVSAPSGSTATLTRDHGIYGPVHVRHAAVLVDGPGLLSVDPLFVKAGADVHLTDASPAIDAGTCTGVPPFDFDDHERPNGAGCDIGADEY